MATTVYDSLVGDATVPMTLLASSTLGYPGSNLYNVFGPVYLPRIYGKDLSALEIASSGKVSVTVRDKYTLDLDRVAASNVTTVSTIPGESLKMLANDGLVSVTMDAASNDLRLAAESNIVFDANAMAYDIAGDINTTAGANLTMKALTGDVTIVSDAQDLLLSAATSNVIVRLDAATSNLVQYAARDVRVSASNLFHLQANSDVSLAAATGSLLLNAAASNVRLDLKQADYSATLFAKSNVALDADEILTTTAGKDLILTSETTLVRTVAPLSTMELSAQGRSLQTSGVETVNAYAARTTLDGGASFINNRFGSLGLAASSSNTQILLADGLTAYSLQDIKATTSNDVVVFATGDVTLDAHLGAMFLRESSNVSVALSNESLIATARSNVQVTASNVSLEAHSLATLTSRSTMHLRSSDADILAGALTDVHVSASNGSIVLTAAQSNAIVDLASATHAVSLYAHSNVRATASNNVVLTADQSLSLTAVKGSAVVSAASNVVLSSSTLDASLSAASNVTLTATEGALGLTATKSNMTLDAKHVALRSTTDLVQSADANMYIGTGANMRMTSSNASVNLTADATRVSLSLDSADHKLSGVALCNVTFNAGLDAEVNAARDSFTIASSNLTLTAAAGTANFKIATDRAITSSGKTYGFTASDDQGYTFAVGANPLLKVTTDKVVINTDLEVLGTLNSIAVTNSELHVNDKTIQLNYPNDDEVVNDGAVNSRSGIVVHGMPATPATADPELAAAMYEKSLTWHYGTGGVDGMLTSAGIDTESFWEMRGGRFQMTSHKSTGAKISFGFRINELDEMEMIKITTATDGTATTRRIAKFGRTLF